MCLKVLKCWEHAGHSSPSVLHMLSEVRVHCMTRACQQPHRMIRRRTDGMLDRDAVPVSSVPVLTTTCIREHVRHPHVTRKRHVFVFRAPP
jgi:hypothetical protein